MEAGANHPWAGRNKQHNLVVEGWEVAGLELEQVQGCTEVEWVEFAEVVLRCRAAGLEQVQVQHCTEIAHHCRTVELEKLQVRRCTEFEFALDCRVAGQPVWDTHHMLVVNKVLARRLRRRPQRLPKLLDRLELAATQQILEGAPQEASFLPVLEGRLAPMASPRPYPPYICFHRTCKLISTRCGSIYDASSPSFIPVIPVCFPPFWDLWGWGTCRWFDHDRRFQVDAIEGMPSRDFCWISGQP